MTRRRRAPIAHVRDLSAGYGHVKVLSGVTFSVPQGSVMGVLGANGAGKSTLLKVLAGQLSPRSGHVHVLGRAVNARVPWSVPSSGVCYIPEGGGFFSTMTVAEQLEFAARSARHRELGAFDEVYEVFPRLRERLRQEAGSLSGGEKRMLAMARVLLMRPRLVLVDEPSLGLAPVIVDELFELLGRLKSRGVSMVVVEQFADRLLQIADGALVITKGRTTYRGSATTLIERPQILEAAYLGVPAPKNPSPTEDGRTSKKQASKKQTSKKQTSKGAGKA